MLLPRRFISGHLVEVWGISPRNPFWSTHEEYPTGFQISLSFPAFEVLKQAELKQHIIQWSSIINQPAVLSVEQTLSEQRLRLLIMVEAAFWLNAILNAATTLRLGSRHLACSSRMQSCKPASQPACPIPQKFLSNPPCCALKNPHQRKYKVVTD